MRNWTWKQFAGQEDPGFGVFRFALISSAGPLSACTTHTCLTPETEMETKITFLHSPGTGTRSRGAFWREKKGLKALTGQPGKNHFRKKDSIKTKWIAETKLFCNQWIQSHRSLGDGFVLGVENFHFITVTESFNDSEKENWFFSSFILNRSHFDGSPFFGSAAAENVISLPLVHLSKSKYFFLTCWLNQRFGFPICSDWGGGAVVFRRRSTPRTETKPSFPRQRGGSGNPGNLSIANPRGRSTCTFPENVSYVGTRTATFPGSHLSQEIPYLPFLAGYFQFRFRLPHPSRQSPRLPAPNRFSSFFPHSVLLAPLLPCAILRGLRDRSRSRAISRHVSQLQRRDRDS